MNLFTPYLSTYPPHVVPERPWWWRCEEVWGVKWLRSADGAEALARRWGDDEPSTDDVLRAIDACDATRPLLAPPPAVGQVWAYEFREADYPEREWSFERVVVGVRRLGGNATSVVWQNGSAAVCRWEHVDARTTVPHFGENWPPPASVLVAGPGAPWAPPRDALPLPR